MNPTRHSDHGPFASSPSVDRYVPLEQFESIIGQSIEAVDRQAGPLAILGGPGMGKTMLCLQLAQRLQGRYEVVLLSSSQLISRGDLLRTLMYELQLPYRGMMDGELRLNLIERLQHPRHGGSDRLVLIVDEAQALSPRILEELRLLTNLQTHGRPCVSLVLCGSLRLEELLNHPQLDSLNQRLAARHVMQPLTAAAAAEYLHAKMQRCEEGSRIAFDRAAAVALHLVSGGVPRLLDQTARRTMQLVAAASSDSMTAVAVERAWHQLQQPLPPWVGESSIGQDTSAESDDAQGCEVIRSEAKSQEPAWTGYRNAGESHLARQSNDPSAPAPRGGWLGEVARSLEAQSSAAKGEAGNRSQGDAAGPPASVGVPPSAGKGLSSAISLPAPQSQSRLEPAAAKPSDEHHQPGDRHQVGDRRSASEASRSTEASPADVLASIGPCIDSWRGCGSSECGAADVAPGAVIVELNQAVVGYGSRPPRDAWATASTAAESLVSEDEVVSPASQMNAVSLSAIEDELWQMVANINLESSAIDSLSPFESIETCRVELEPEQEIESPETDYAASYVEAWAPASGYAEVESYDGEMSGEAANAELSEVCELELQEADDDFEACIDGSAAFQAFAPHVGSHSLFSDPSDDAAQGNAAAEPVMALPSEPAADRPRVDDLQSIAAAAGDQSQLFSLADWDATPAQPSVPHDDRDILVIDSSDESRPAPAPSRSMAAGFIPQSYTQLFESLRR